MAQARGPRTQAERRDETRRALLDATVETLCAVGYARTTTGEVARRAGVSRGAQLRYFPTKVDLVVAAVERAFALQERRFRERFDTLPAEQRTLARAVDELWAVFDSPVYAAILELIVAARTDPSLREVVHAFTAGFHRSVNDTFAELFPELADVPNGDRLVGFAFAVMQGAAISGYSGFDDPANAVTFTRQLTAIATPKYLPHLGTPFRH